MRFEPKDILFDDDIDVVDDNIIDGYLWATNSLVNIAGYREVHENDYINFYPCYDINRDRWYVEVSGMMNQAYFVKELDLTENELDYIINQTIIHYCGNNDAWTELIEEVRERRSREA